MFDRGTPVSNPLINRAKPFASRTNDVRARCDLKIETRNRIEDRTRGPAFLYFLGGGGWARAAGKAEASRGESYYGRGEPGMLAQSNKLVGITRAAEPSQPLVVQAFTTGSPLLVLATN